MQADVKSFGGGGAICTARAHWKKRPEKIENKNFVLVKMEMALRMGG
jgi:hypothetical protein